MAIIATHTHATLYAYASSHTNITTMPRLSSADLLSKGYTPDGIRMRLDKAERDLDKCTGQIKRERDLHDQILAYCRSKGLPVVHSRMDVPATVGVGTPDFVIALPAGRTLWVEAKARKGKLTKEQNAWMWMLIKLGHQACVVRSMGEFLEQVGKGA